MQQKTRRAPFAHGLVAKASDKTGTFSVVAVALHRAGELALTFLVDLAPALLRSSPEAAAAVPRGGSRARTAERGLALVRAGRNQDEAWHTRSRIRAGRSELTYPS